MKKAKKIVALLLCAVLLISASVAGTLAYLTQKTATVQNTFTVGKVSLGEDEDGDGIVEGGLDETKVDQYGVAVTPASRVTKNTYKLIPGKTYAKDPVLTVKGTTDVDCWLFFKVVENNPGNFLTYELNLDGWTELETGVYYRAITASTADQSFQLLKGKTGFTNGYVTISEDLTLEQMATADDASLIFTGYAIQKEGFDNPAAAWDELNP